MSEANETRYLPIEEHGVIGDLHSVAVVGTDGKISWSCLPHFDSPSVFGSILDADKGGFFSIEAADLIKNTQSYLPDTNILVTRFHTQGGLAQIEDFMPVRAPENLSGTSVHQIVRHVSCITGSVTFTLSCSPRYPYGEAVLEKRPSNFGTVFETKEDICFGLKTSLPDESQEEGTFRCTFKLNEGESLSFIFFSADPRDLETIETLLVEPSSALENTAAFWKDWIDGCNYQGRWREIVHRSALTLKLLTFCPTGAIIAAPTTSLPEGIGGTRNWDYRYTWIRDASFTLYALMRVGFHEEVEAFTTWLHERCFERFPESETPLQIMYTIHGEAIPEERELEHLEGYRGSKPVRVGNGAADQLQLDIYGELIDAIYLQNKFGQEISYDLWKRVRKLTDWVAANWNREDEGIWEVRSGRQHFVFSKMMCWVALDRAIRIARESSLPCDSIRWQQQRDMIYDEIMERGWNQEIGAFTQSYDSDLLDASVLLMPLVKFISPTDPRMLSTIDAIQKDLSKNALVNRYDPELSNDGVGGEEGSFTMCTFWLIECLTRAGRIEEAQVKFEQMLGLSNHLGLYAEEIGQHGEALGNFPQAFTHLSLISAAYSLDKALG